MKVSASDGFRRRILLAAILLFSLPVVTAEATEWTPDGRAIPDGVRHRPNPIPEGYQRLEGDVLAPQQMLKGGWEPNLWGNGAIPYEFVEGDGREAYWYDGTTFAFAASPPRILTTDPDFDFLHSAYKVGHLLRVAGSTSNDNNSANLYTITLITETELYLDPGDVLVDEAAGADVRVAVTQSVSPYFQTLMLAAMAEWEAVADIDFVPRAGEDNYLKIMVSLYNQAMLGLPSTPQASTVEIYNWDNRFIMCHELAHSLGELHEQSRPDQAQFVTINYGAVSQDGCGGDPCDYNFYPTTTGTAYPIAPWGAIYDFDSVMHYGQYAFSICKPSMVPDSCPDSLTTIDCNPDYAEYQDLIGQRDHLSFWDRTTMSYLYADPLWVFLHRESPSTTNSGSFWNPRTDFNAALNAVQTNGKLVVLYPDVIDVLASGSRLFTKRMTFEAPTGEVLLR